MPNAEHHNKSGIQAQKKWSSALLMSEWQVVVNDTIFMSMGDELAMNIIQYINLAMWRESRVNSNTMLASQGKG